MSMQLKPETNRRSILQAGLGLGLTAGVLPASSAAAGANDSLDLSSAEARLKNYVKLIGTIAQDAPTQLLDYVSQEQPNYFADDDPWAGGISNYQRFKTMREPVT